MHETDAFRKIEMRQDIRMINSNLQTARSESGRLVLRSADAAPAAQHPAQGSREAGVARPLRAGRVLPRHAAVPGLRRDDKILFDARDMCAICGDYSSGEDRGSPISRQLKLRIPPVILRAATAPNRMPWSTRAAGRRRSARAPGAARAAAWGYAGRQQNFQPLRGAKYSVRSVHAAH